MFQWGYGGKNRLSFFSIQDKGFLALGIPAAVDIGKMGLFYLLIFLFLKKKKKIDIQVSGYVIHSIWNRQTKQNQKKSPTGKSSNLFLWSSN